MKKILIISVLLAFAGFSYAQQHVLREINVDLPDETEETDLLAKGEWQVETGYIHTAYTAGPSSSMIQGTVRYGAFSRLELRLLVEEGRGRDRYMLETVQATYPLALSAKISLMKGHDLLPDMTLVNYTKLPFTAHTSEQALYWSPIFILAFQNKFGDKWKLEYNVGIQQEAFENSWAGLVNASLHYQVADQLEVFAEYYGQYSGEVGPQHNAGLGLAYQLNNYFEFFAAGGTALNDNPYNRFFSGGMALRIPN